MATGDILSCSIDSSGWFMLITIEGLSSGGTYISGYGSDNNFADSKVILTLTRNSFDGVAVANTLSQTIYGTKQKRLAYPDEATADETIDGSNVIIRYALSDWVFAGEVSIVANIAADLYTESGNGSLAAVDMAVTNNSIQIGQPCVANWSIPLQGRRLGFNELSLTGDTEHEVRVIGFHRDGQNKRPLAVVKVTATGVTSGHVETVYIASESIEQETYEDAEVIPEFIGSYPIADFTQGEYVDLDFIAYPLVGSTLFDTSASAKVMPNSDAVTQRLICDKNHTYGDCVCVIDPTGDDSTGVVISLDSFDSENPPAAFLTIGGASVAIQAFNLLTYSRDEVGGGVIYAQAGSYLFTDQTASQTSTETYMQIIPFPGVDRSSVIIASQSGDDSLGDHIVLNNITLNYSTTFLINGTTYAWFHKVLFSGTGATQQYTANAIQYFTGCTINQLSQGIGPYSTRTTHSFGRGNIIDISTETVDINVHVFIGNKLLSGRVDIFQYYSGMTIPEIHGMIIGYNRLSVTLDGVAIYLDGDSTGDNLVGHAVVGNIVERTIEGSSPLMQIAADSTGEYTINNVIVWGNTCVGQRFNFAYNDYILNGVGPAYRRFWSIKNNIFEDWNIVTDVDAHGGTAGAERIGNHALVHGCGIASNISRGNGGAGDLYNPEFIGLKSLVGDETTQIDCDFVDDASSFGTALGTGDYHLGENSAALGLVFDTPIKYDKDGNSRLVNGAIGAFEYITEVVGNVIAKIYRQFLGGF